MFRHAAFMVLTLCCVLAACDRTPRDQSVRFADVTPPVKVRPSPVTGPGVILGSWMGVDTAAQLDDADRAKNRQAESRAYTAPIGQQVTWANEDSGNSGTVVVTQDGYSGSGAYCRQFQQSVSLQGRKLQGHANVCQQADGSWKAE